MFDASHSRQAPSGNLHGVETSLRSHVRSIDPALKTSASGGVYEELSDSVTEEDIPDRILGIPELFA